MGVVHLIIATICASLFSIFFKIFEIRQVDSMKAIFYNYVTAFVIGIAQSYDGSFVTNPFTAKWLVPVIILGFIFIAGMVILDVSTRKVGVAISTVCSRASMIIPIILSYIFVAGSRKPVWIAIALVIIGMSLTVWTGNQERSGHRFSAMDVIIPLSVFLCFGLSNSINKIIQDRIVVARAEWPEEMVNRELALVTAMIFLVATILAAIPLFKSKTGFKWRNVIGGVCFGIARL